MRLRYGPVVLLLALAAAGCETEEVVAPAPESRTAARTTPEATAPAPPADGPTASEPAPDFTLPGPDGDFALIDHRGHVVVLNFWATWNELSLDGMGALADLQETLVSEELVVVGIAEDDDALGALAAWAEANEPPPYPLVADTAGAVAAAYGGIELFPTTVVVDREGRLRAHHTGILTEDGLLDLIAPVLIEDDEPLSALPPPQPGHVRVLVAGEVEALVRDGAVLVDVRDPAVRLATGALPYALHRPAALLSSIDLPANFATPLIFVDADGSAADEVARAALGWGYVAVYRLDGGVAAWAAEGLPLEPVPSPPDSSVPSHRETVPPVVPARSVIG